MNDFISNNKLVVFLIALIISLTTGAAFWVKYTDGQQSLAEKACGLNFSGSHATLLESGDNFSCYTQAKGARLIVGHMVL